MNILMVVYSPLGLGGAEVSTLSLTKALIKKGHNVYIASTGEYPDVPTILFKKYGKVPFYTYHNLYLEKFLKKVIQEKNIDIIHAQDRLTSVPAVRAAHALEKKCVLHFRDYWFACPKSSCLKRDLTECTSCGISGIAQCSPPHRIPWDAYKMAYITSIRPIIEQADAKICISTAVKNKLNAVGVKNNVYVVHNSRENVTLPSVEEKKFVDVVFFGSFFETKGIHQIIDVMKDVVQEPNVRFTMVGDGPLMPLVKEFIAKNNLIDTFVLTGRVNHQKVWDYYALADIVVLPSLWSEPLSGIPIECTVAGKPIVASANGGTVDMVEDGVTGFLVDAKDKTAWVERILTLVKDKQLREKMGKEAHRKYQEFTPEVNVANVEKIYNALNI